MTVTRKAAKIAWVDQMPETWRGAVVAIGNFDGVHRGHQAILSAARVEAQRLGCPCLMLTFEPHPRAFFTGRPIFRLTPLPLKSAAAAASGTDGALVVPFDAALAKKSAESFVQEILLDRLRICGVVTGRDFHFGRARQGDSEFLQRQGLLHGFTVTLVPALEDGPEPVSSTRVRSALAVGDIANANRLLGWSFSFAERVQHGAARGRKLGFPTANMELDPATELAAGVYAVRFLLSDGTMHEGVASYGRRPTFDNGNSLFETFLFDYSGDLYGQLALVSLIAFVRREERFDSASALVARMHEDSFAARALLAQHPVHGFESRLYSAWTRLARPNESTGQP